MVARQGKSHVVPNYLVGSISTSSLLLGYALGEGLI